MSQSITKTKFTFDSKGYVMPPDTMIGYMEKNWLALILGRDNTYKWSRKFIPKHLPMPNSMPKYHQSSFVIGHVYEFHASFQEKSDEQIAEKKHGIPEDKHWMVEKRARMNSKYNGFWRVIGIDNDGIRMVRMFDKDMKYRFPDTPGSTVVQPSLFEFMENEENE